MGIMGIQISRNTFLLIIFVIKSVSLGCCYHFLFKISYTGNPCLMIAQQLFEIMTVLNEEIYNLCLKLYLLQYPMVR